MWHHANSTSIKGSNNWSYHGKIMSSHDKVEAFNSWHPKDSNIQVQLLLGLSQSGIVFDYYIRHDGEHSSSWDEWMFLYGLDVFIPGENC